jgi:hypothetical protein
VTDEQPPGGGGGGILRGASAASVSSPWSRHQVQPNSPRYHLKDQPLQGKMSWGLDWSASPTSASVASAGACSMGSGWEARPSAGVGCVEACSRSSRVQVEVEGVRGSSASAVA